MNLASVIIASNTAAKPIMFPSPGSNNPPPSYNQSVTTQGTPADPGGNVSDVSAPNTSGFIRRGYLGNWCYPGLYDNGNPSIFNGAPLDTQTDSYVAFGAQENMDQYCMEWKGYWQCPTTADWNFYITADDVGMFWIGSAALNPTISNVTCNSGTNVGYNTRSQSLTAGQWYPIRVRYQEWGGAESLNLFAAPVDTQFVALYNYGWATMKYVTNTDGY